MAVFKHRPVPEEVAELVPLNPLLYEALVRHALEEDLGTAGDITTDSSAASGERCRAELVARGQGRIAGLDIAIATFRLLDPEIAVELQSADGMDASAGQVLAVIEGSARSVLTGERTALNFLGRLSGVATTTRSLVRAVEGYPTHIACTRKTTPGLRAVEKYAVRAGGGINHRFGLSDGVLIKDNHRLIAGGIAPAVRRVRDRIGHMVKLQVEVDTLAELDEALALDIDAVLLDNMSPEILRQAVDRADGQVVTEASGGITLETARDVAASGVDLMSVGWITHSAPSLDVALDFVPA